MTKTEIEQAAKTYSDFYDGMYSGRYFGFIAGANFVNSKQPYTAEDIVSAIKFGMTEQRKGKCIITKNMIVKFWDSQFINEKLLQVEDDELIKLWEESK
jgi:hypothetical protein